MFRSGVESLVRRCSTRKFVRFTSKSASSSSPSTASSPQKKQEQDEDDAPQQSNQQQYSSTKETHFGFRTVSEKEKAEKVRTVFDTVAAQYDLMNDAMSMGVHRVWKDILVHRLDPGKSMKIIDVAGGTGDIAFRILKYQKGKRQFGKPILPFDFPLQNLPTNKKPENEVEAQYQALEGSSSNLALDHTLAKDREQERTVLVSDINPKMLEVGKKRAKTALTLDEQRRINWMEGNAENLSDISDNSFDAYTISFGIRNCVRIDKVLSEAYRILKPGGRFLCLEFSNVNNSLVKWVYDQYSFQVIPAMGQVLVGDFDSYVYLVESIRKFPTQDNFKSMIEHAGFRFVSYENLTFGISCIHSGFKL